MIEIKVADEMDNAALAKIYYDIRLKEFVWEKEVCMDDFKKSTEGERILAGGWSYSRVYFRVGTGFVCT